MRSRERGKRVKSANDNDVRKGGDCKFKKNKENNKMIESVNKRLLTEYQSWNTFLTEIIIKTVILSFICKLKCRAKV